jgi:hypothetical protein
MLFMAALRKFLGFLMFGAASVAAQDTLYTASYSDGVLVLPVVQSGGNFYTASMLLTDKTKLQFELKSLAPYSNTDTARMSAFINGTLYVEQVKVNGQNYRATLGLVQQEPLTLKLNSIELYTDDETRNLWNLPYEEYLASNHSWNYNIVRTPEHPVRSGLTAERFELRPGDCNGTDCARPYERAEAVEEGTHQYEGDEYWYGWSFYFPTDTYVVDDKIGGSGCLTIAQFQQYPLYDPAFMISRCRSGSLVLRTFPVATNSYTREYQLLDSAAVPGTWHDIRVHARWTSQATGFLHVWVDGVERVNYSGPTRTVGNEYVYFKHGLYRGGGSPWTSIMYVDELRRGKSLGEVEFIRPLN